MGMRSFDYSRAGTIDEALSLMGQDGDGLVRPLAGGTDLLPLMKCDIVTPTRLIDIKRVSDLPSGVEETGEGLEIGALTTLSEIETNSVIRERYTALAEAAALAASPQLRNMATIGGNLLQRPRCWYYRDPHFHCWLKGGDECFARDGENQQHALFGDSPCVAVHPSDLPTALVALNAEVHLRGSNGERRVPLANFFALPTEERRTENTLGSDELIVSLRLPTPASGTRSTYLKAMDRKVWAFALVGVAAVVRMDGSEIADARVVLGGVANIPWRVEAAEQALIGNAPSDDLAARASEVAVDGAHPLEHNGYKAPLAKTLVRRAVTELTSQHRKG